MPKAKEVNNNKNIIPEIYFLSSISYYLVFVDLLIVLWLQMGFYTRSSRISKDY